MHKPWLAWLVICAFVLMVLLIVRGFGIIAPLDMMWYDYLVRWRMEPNSTDDLIKIVGMTEDDLREYGYPIDDEKLAQILTTVNAQEPCVIGLDLYRDQKEPRNGEHYPKLESALKEFDRVLAIERVGYFEAPEALRGSERVVSNNLPIDHIDGIYRRGPLFIEYQQGKPDANVVPSLSLALAVKYLEKTGANFEQIPTGDDKPLLRLGNTIIPRITSNSGGYVGLGIVERQRQRTDRDSGQREDERIRLDYEYLISFRKPLRFGVMETDENDPLGQAGKDTPYDYSFGTVLKGKLLEGALKDKIVIISGVMQSMKDSNPTPIHNNFRGVQQHAMMTRQLIDIAEGREKPMRWWPEWAEILSIAACTLVGGGLGLFFRSPLKLVPAVLLMIGVIAAIDIALFFADYWVPYAPLAIAGLLTSATLTSFVVLLERADRNAMRAILSKHVSKRVADYILSHREHILEGGMIPGRALNATIVFTDLAGFSTASEKLTPDQTLRWLNDYMTPMVKLVEAHDGEVNKFIGDAIMALFGAPYASGEGEEGLALDATKAIRCALRMREEVQKLNARWLETSPDMPAVVMRVGIFTGPIVDGSFGDSQRFEYTVIGDAVNRANRLEAAGKEIKDQLTEAEKICTILVGPKTYALVSHLFEMVAVQNLALKGITERVTVHRVLSERAKPLSSK